ncbi:MAG TPA: ATP-binding protein [Terriglobales bacterium]|nr:ATP-binding protein [Terriglobales bacterium]
MRVIRYGLTALAAMGLSFAATALLIYLQPDRAITLLIYLPGITVVEALFGVWGGMAAVLLSVAGSALYRLWYFPSQVQHGIPGFYATWEEEMILLVVGMFVVALMELRRRSGLRAATGAQQMAALLENVADAVVIFDRTLRVVSVNPAARALLERPDQGLVGEHVDALLQRFHFVSEQGEPPSLQEATRAGVVVRAEGTIVEVDSKREIHVLVSAAPLRNARNQIEGSLVLLTDITALKELQRRTLDNARHLAIAQMVSGLSHDFNHVLDIVRRGLAVLELQEDAPAAERRKYREMIDRAAVDGSQIVRRLRDYLAGGVGAMGPVDLAAVAHEAVELTRPLWRARAGLEVVEDLQPAPPVHGSANDLRRILINLIFNAIEALGTMPGRIQVHTGPRPGAGPAWAVAWVEDTGPGIAPEAQRKLFQPYYTTKPHGMGMGLFGAQKIALAHGGTLRLVSEPGTGTRFLLELPARTEAAAPVAAEPPRREIA